MISEASFVSTTPLLRALGQRLERPELKGSAAAAWSSDRAGVGGFSQAKNTRAILLLREITTSLDSDMPSPTLTCVSEQMSERVI